MKPIRRFKGIGAVPGVSQSSIGFTKPLSKELGKAPGLKGALQYFSKPIVLRGFMKP